MPDPVFAAEMAALAAAHRERERGRIEDGMAVGGATPGGQAWMDFSGARMPITPDPGPSHDVRNLRSEFKPAPKPDEIGGGKLGNAD